MFFHLILLLNHEYVHINLIFHVFIYLKILLKKTYVHFQFDNHVLFFQKFELVSDVILRMYGSSLQIVLIFLQVYEILHYVL